MPAALSPVQPNASAVVRASAGTGKTWTLVTRLIRLLLDGARPDGILAITFTRKAAAEMDQRLHERLASWAGYDDQQLDAALAECGLQASTEIRSAARDLFETLVRSARPVHTTTFHAFCQEILRRFPFEADTPPGFEVAETTSLLRTAAWDVLFSVATREPESDVARALETLFTECGSLFTTHKVLDNFINHASDWLAFTEGADDPVAYAIDQLQDQLNLDPDQDPYAELMLLPVSKDLQTYADLLRKSATKTDNKYADLIETRLAKDTDAQSRYTTLNTVFLKANGEPRKIKTDNAARLKKLGPDNDALYLNLFDKLAGLFVVIREQIARHRTFRLNSAWYLAGSSLLAHYQRIKHERRQLDFSDLEWQACRVLNASGHADWVQYKLDARIDHLLIDEFQDTNPTQWRLLFPLLEELAAGQADRQRSVFLVGDIKQSIYGFRRADPRLFETAGNWMLENIDATSWPLHQSWRSAPAIIDVVNRVFDEDSLPGFETHTTHLESAWGRVEILPLCHPVIADDETIRFRNPLKQARVVPGISASLIEGRVIAAQIKDLVAKPTIIGTTDSRPLGFGDILILVRRRARVADYEQALREANIPLLSADRGTLLQSREINDMVALLNTLIAPFNNLDLASVLRCPLFDCSDEDLMTLARFHARSWWSHLTSEEWPSGSALGRAGELLARWHTIADKVPIHDLLDRIYKEGNVLNRFRVAAPDRLKSRVTLNLERLIELALEIGAGRYPSLSRFLDHLAAVRDAGTEAPDTPPDHGSGSRVRILTIHGAKGLEAPVVFLADSSSGIRENSAWQAQIDWPHHAIAPVSFVLTPGKDARDEFTRQLVADRVAAERIEEMHLLYVALTRARQMLFVSGNSRKEEAQGWYALLAQQLDFDPGTGFHHESGTPPKPQASKTEKSDTVLALDPRLSQPLPNRSATGEIHPSQIDSDDQHTQQDNALALLRGSAIHRMLELTTQDTDGDSNDIPERVAREFGLSASTTDLDQWWQEVLLVTRLSKFQHLFFTDAQSQSWNEVSIQYQDTDGLTVHGIIDRLILSAGVVTIIDYKTHSHATPGNVEQLAAHYIGQMQGYAQGVAGIWPDHEIKTLLLFTSCAEIVEVKVAE